MAWSVVAGPFDSKRAEEHAVFMKSLSDNREYVIQIDPRILELLGPSLYTNIYYVLAELIANAYDANAKNVYVIEGKDEIIVEDDGNGMSYKDRDIAKYLNVAIETRTTNEDIYVEGSDKKRKKMGRKGIGKLAALAVSEKVFVKTVKNGEKSGFILSRHVDSDHRLESLGDDDITFAQGDLVHGTSIVMKKPQYVLHKTADAVRRNLLKMFPFVNKSFRIHIKTLKSSLTVEDFDTSVIKELGALITLGEEYKHLNKNFKLGFTKEELGDEELLINKPTHEIPLKMVTKDGHPKEFTLQIKGWIGAYATTRGRKKDPGDFPDNFVSLLSNGKLGEYNILPTVGKNKLPEVYIVGQLHVDLFEETSLPDMALSNRQGYKSDDPRYTKVTDYVRDTLLPEIVSLRITWAKIKNKEKVLAKERRQREMEQKLRKDVETYKDKVSENLARRFASGREDQSSLKEEVRSGLNSEMPIMGLKKRIDSNKKRILICHTSTDKDFADVIYDMLAFNNIPNEDIIYTSSLHAESRVPENMGVFKYLRDFFVDSYSEQKIFVVYVTSDDMARAWGAVTEVGAGWITECAHKIFNLTSHRPRQPLNIANEWQTSSLDKGGSISMSEKEFDKFVLKVIDVCQQLGYRHRSRADNETELRRYVTVTK